LIVLILSAVSSKMATNTVFSTLSPSAQAEFLAKCKARIMDVVSKKLDVALEYYADIRKIPDIHPHFLKSMSESEIEARNEDALQDRLDMTTLEVMNDVIRSAFGVDEAFDVAVGSVGKHFCDVDTREYMPNVEA
jgi:hypothetical protein